METLDSLRSHKVKDKLDEVRICVGELRQSKGRVTDLKGSSTAFMIKELFEHDWLCQERK